MEIYPSVYLIKDIFVNQYLLSGKDGLLLIDTGVGGNQANILNTVRLSGHQPADIKTIIITHADSDHYGSLAAIKALTNATTFATEIEALAIQAGRSSRELKPRGLRKILFSVGRPMMKIKPSQVETTLKGGEVFSTLGGLEVLLTPGHTPGHISLYSPTQRLLFAGDSIRVVHGVPAPSGEEMTWDMAKAKESFEMQLALDPIAIFAGHGVWFKEKSKGL